MLEFKVNEYLSLRLENEESVIYVNDERFTICKFLLLNIPVDKITSLDEIQSIDEAADQLDGSLEPRIGLTGRLKRSDGISPEAEFWGHCSNLQVWYENEYNTKLLHHSIAFPLLKELTDAGDPVAQHVFKEEIAKRVDSGYLPVVYYLLINHYLEYLTERELTSIEFLQNFGNMGQFKTYITDITPRTAGEWLVKAKTFELFQEFDKVEEHLKAGLKVYPRNIELIKHYTKCVMDRGDLPQVIKNIKTLIEIEPENGDFLNTLAMAYERARDDKNAVKYFKQAISTEPTYLYPYLNYAALLDKQGKVAERDAILNEVRVLEFTDELTGSEHVGFCSHIGKYELGNELAKKVLLLNPGMSEMWMSLALNYKELRKYLQERRCLKKVIALNTDFQLTSTALNNLGILSVESSRYKRGVDLLEQSVEMDPENDLAWANLSIANIGIFFLSRCDICMKISEELRTLKVYREYNDVEGIEKSRDSIERLKNQYWSLEYECPFCKRHLPQWNKFCIHCGTSLLLESKEGAEKLTPAELEAMKEKVLQAHRPTPSPSPPTSLQDYVDPKFGISFKYPSMWTVRTLPGTPTVTIMNETKIHEFSESVAIMIIPGIYYTLKEYSNQSLRQLKKTIKHFELLTKPTRTTIANSPAMSFTYKCIQQQYLVKIMTCVIIKNRIAYNISCFADFKEFESVLPLFKEILNSFKVARPEDLAPTTTESLKSAFERHKYPINTEEVISDINALRSGSSPAVINKIMEGFMMASIISDMKGFGPLNAAFELFLQKLKKLGLHSTLPRDMQNNLSMLEDIFKQK